MSLEALPSGSRFFTASVSLKDYEGKPSVRVSEYELVCPEHRVAKLIYNDNPTGYTRVVELDDKVFSSENEALEFAISELHRQVEPVLKLIEDCKTKFENNVPTIPLAKAS